MNGEGGASWGHGGSSLHSGKGAHGTCSGALAGVEGGRDCCRRRPGRRGVRLKVKAQEEASRRGLFSPEFSFHV